MGFSFSIWLIVLGVLGAANLIIARRPDAAEYIAKIAPYQGWIGALSALGGVFGILQAILNIGWLALYPIWWPTFLAVSVVQAGLGVLLGVGVIKTFVTQPKAVAKLDEVVTKLAPFQGTLGLVAIGLGAWSLIATLLFFG